ncbi:HK97-gp10 family putative phage morphogenesis protein [Treponema sp. R6D11]
MSVEVINKNNKTLLDIKIPKGGVLIGYPSKNSKPSKGNPEVTVADVAVFNEFGSEKMHRPPRPFMRQTFEKNAEEMKEKMQNSLKRISKGADVDRELLKMGAIYKSRIQREITDGTFAGLAESTKRAKKSTKPLIDTGQMRMSVAVILEKSTEA